VVISGFGIACGSNGLFPGLCRYGAKHVKVFDINAGACVDTMVRFRLLDISHPPASRSSPSYLASFVSWLFN
jgi:hypothetical protein